MDKAHRKPRPKSKTSDISKQSPSPLHHTFVLGRARFIAQPLSALGLLARNRVLLIWILIGIFDFDPEKVLGLLGNWGPFLESPDY